MARTQLVIHHDNKRIFITDETEHVDPEALLFAKKVLSEFETGDVGIRRKYSRKSHHKSPGSDIEEGNGDKTPNEDEGSNDGALNEV